MSNPKFDMEEVRFELNGIVSVMAIVLEAFEGDIVSVKPDDGINVQSLACNFSNRAGAYYEPALNNVWLNLKNLLDRVEAAV